MIKVSSHQMPGDSSQDRPPHQHILDHWLHWLHTVPAQCSQGSDLAADTTDTKLSTTLQSTAATSCPMRLPRMRMLGPAERIWVHGCMVLDSWLLRDGLLDAMLVWCTPRAAGVQSWLQMGRMGAAGCTAARQATASYHSDSARHHRLLSSATPTNPTGYEHWHASSAGALHGHTP